jgi:hypothetical protein
MREEEEPMRGDGEVMGLYEPGENLPRNHASGFDRALELALRELPQEEEPPELTVTYRVRLRWSDNPGWVIDGYIVELR